MQAMIFFSMPVFLVEQSGTISIRISDRQSVNRSLPYRLKSSRFAEFLVNYVVIIITNMRTA